MEANYFTILYWFCHISTWIRHGCTHVPHPEPPSHLPPHTIPLGHPSAPAPSILYHASTQVWRFISHIILYMFQCHFPKSSHPHPLPQSPQDCSIHFKGLWEQIFSVFFILLKEFFLTGFNWTFYYNTIALRFIYLLAYLYAGVILEFINVYSEGILRFMLFNFPILFIE